MSNEKEKNSLFREKSLSQIESPEALDHYLRVTTPGIWLFLSVVIVLLLGAVVFGIFGHIDSSVPAAVISDGKKTVCYVPEKALDAVKDGTTVKVNGEEYELTGADPEPVLLSEKTDVYVLLAGGFSVNDIVYSVPVSGEQDKGVYKGTVLVESIRPVDFLIKRR